MPELPEVETIRRGLEDLIVGRKIVDIETDSPKQIQPSLEIVRKAVLGSTIKKTGRRAKLLQLFLDNGKILVFHLKLTGRLLVRKKGAPTDDWQHVTISLSDNWELRFADLRKFGWIKLIEDEKELEKLLNEFGPEPMDDLTPEKFKKIISLSSRPIKIILMDQQRISGIGNIYASDALFLAHIDPKRPAKSISKEETEKLFEAIIEVLKRGIKYRGASDQYYLDAKGEKGEYQNHFLVYGKEGKKCPNCKGVIKKNFLGGRGTYFCPHCQK
ncbi:bifunctional DNA-formamidopyrimidine glycosylase/DNA-(apurinic or apyrimidinic site) lyase [Patescibacteria group bacterium]|nr:bifunctional DNA-formamidopyrimidine glycosylase/DNA-(apurinic or apyrimidinic site) lyase [Patescibacteria group bacterium]